MTQKTRWSILEIDPPYYACRVQSIPSQRDCHPAAHDLGDRSEGSLNDVLNATETSTQEPRHCGARRSLTSTVALWAGRIVLICIAGVVSILSGLSLVVRFFGGH